MASAPKTPSLYARMQIHGTLTETPRDVPDARFALPSTIHWMRALAILAADQKLDFASARAFYAKVQARGLPERELNTVCEQLLFVLNQIAALQTLATATNKADVARTAIVAWYYGVYSAASAMTAAMDGSFQDNHTDTARKWQERFPAKNLAMHPFADCLSSILPSAADAELAPVKARGQHHLVNTPANAQEAWGCCAEYLSGTANWERWNVEERVRETPAFKALAVTDFRKQAAQLARRGLRPTRHRVSPSGVAIPRKGQLARCDLSRLWVFCADPIVGLHRRSADRIECLRGDGGRLLLAEGRQGGVDRLRR
jgi:hypothetical protein